MELAISSKAGVLSDEEIDGINVGSLLSEVVSLKEEFLNYIATFTAENGAELNFEFHCSDSAEARDHVEEFANLFKKNIHFLRISGEKWNAEPDKLKRVFLKRKLELEFLEYEVQDSSFSTVKPGSLQVHSN